MQAKEDREYGLLEGGELGAREGFVGDGSTDEGLSEYKVSIGFGGDRRRSEVGT